MTEDFKITIGDMLKASCFQTAQLLAGSGGLNRTVKWVHILDTPIYVSLTGNEFILSTGRIFGDGADGIPFIKQLIERHVSGICIELVSYIQEIPAELIRLAEEKDFPLIVFRQPVSFIDITRELNSMIISQDVMTFSLVEKFTQQLSDVLLAPHDIEDILGVLQRFLSVNLAYLPVQGQPVFLPGMHLPEQNKLLDILKQLPCADEADFIANQFFKYKGSVVCRKIEAFNLKKADIYMFSMNRELTDFEHLIFAKAILAISQDLLRELFVKEQKRHEENRWIYDWCKGRIKDHDIVQRLNRKEAAPAISGYFASVIRFATDLENHRALHEFMMHTLIRARSMFEREGFLFLGTNVDNQIVMVLLDHESSSPWKKRAKRVVDQLMASRISFPTGVTMAVGIGKMVSQGNALKWSYQTAEEAIEIQNRIGRDEPFYDALHIYRIIALVNKAGHLDEFVADYLAPVIQYDTLYHGDLMKTLQVYCDCGGSKQKTAEKLFIVRQTLYLRIKKLEELLGADFMEAEKRLAIEFALNARKYFKSETVK